MCCPTTDGAVFKQKPREQKILGYEFPQKTQTLKKRQSFSWMVRTNVSHEERRLAAFHHFQALKSSRLLVSNILDLKIPMWVDDPIGGPASFQLGGVENINCQQKTTKSFGRRQIRSLRGDLSWWVGWNPCISWSVVYLATSLFETLFDWYIPSATGLKRWQYNAKKKLEKRSRLW